MRPLMIALLLPATAFLCLAGSAGSQTANEKTPVSFYKEIKPILRKRCQGCHQPATQGGKLILTSYEAFRAGGGNGASFKPGHPEDSVIMRYITGNPPSMPKNQKPLDPGDIELIKRWIAEGAKNDTPVVKDPIDQQHPPVYVSAPVISAMAYSPDGKTLAVSGYREILLHKTDGSGIVGRLVGKSVRIESLAYSPDGKILAAVGGAPARFGEVQFWNTETNTLIKSVELSYDSLFGCSFSPDGKKLACGAADNSVRIVSVPDGKLLLKFDNHSDWTFSTVWAMDDKHILSTGRDKAIKLIVAENGSFVDDINTFTSSYRTMARNPKADNVIVGGDDGLPRLYQIFRTHVRTMNQEDYDLLRTFEKQPGQINAVAFNADGSKIAVAGEGTEARVYKTDDGKRLATMSGLEGVTFSLVFSPNGEQLAVGGLDGKVRLFNVSTGSLVTAFVPVPLAKQTAAK
jgi:hypothetical protein